MHVYLNLMCQGVDYISVSRKKLNLPLDCTSSGVSVHLGQIADYMHEWEGPIAETLGLTSSDVAKIKTRHPIKLELQM